MSIRFVILVALAVTAGVVQPLAQGPALADFGTETISQRATDAPLAAEFDALIKGFESFGKGGGIVFTRRSIYVTADDGGSWAEIKLPRQDAESIAEVHFTTVDSGWALLANVDGASLNIQKTADGGRTWEMYPIGVHFTDCDVGNASIHYSLSGEWQLLIPIQTSSNFRGTITLGSYDLSTWEMRSRTVVPNSPDLDEKREVVSGGWTLRNDGTCLGVKSGCFQETRLYSGGNEITPPPIRALAGLEREAAEIATVPMFAAAPGGSTRISTNKGFDKCTAFSTTQAQTWWDNSPYYNVNIYMSGRNRACQTQPFNGNPAWLTQVNAMGWGLIPTVVGYQSPCTSSTTTAKLSYEAATAEQQGRGEADIAVNDAAAIGLTSGSILYYDMERYDPPNPDTLGCEPATRAFLKGWTDRIHELGFKSGTYGSPFNAQNHWVNLPAASKMDVVWLANWDNRSTVWFFNSFPSFPISLWPDHQRVKQYFNGTESWGGVSFNIDRDISDAPVAAPLVARNMPADFDGDGRSDVSVFRPADGVWYVLSSLNSAYSGTGFGVGSDVLAPGDFDGDGKTDYSVFRPSDGTWYTLSKAGTFSSRQFGAATDVPVPADYNGDGKTDIAVFRPSNGYWYIANSDSLATYTFIQFGQTGDKPVPGDYDGDGKTDLAVYRPSDGTWYVMKIADLSFYAVRFGIASDRPVQGDYDGDGKTDQAVYRDGTWYMMQSSAGFSAFQFGLADDLPATGDFDGDGKADIAVFRQSNGNWFMSRSQAGFSAVGFGQNGDRPVEAAYLPQ